MEPIQVLKQEAISLLQSLIASPSFSTEEGKTADILQDYLDKKGIPAHRVGHNVWAHNRFFDPSKTTILLNSHHDTVRPNSGYSRDPFHPSIEEGKLYGLGSNDAGGCLVTLAAAFCSFYNRENLPFNLVFAASAEEEISGKGGIGALLPQLPEIDCALVGEPTLLQLAVAEKGLMVLDCRVTGQAGHAAREEGENAIYKAMPDITWFQNFTFPKFSLWLNAIKMNVTVIETSNKVHNVVPADCHFVVDVRLTDTYSPEEVLDIIRQHVQCNVTPRSTRLRATAIAPDHPLVQAALTTGGKPYGSPTLSDKALMPFPTLKMGPGDSARSHSADEFIYVQEIQDGISTYIQLLEHYKSYQPHKPASIL